MRILRMTLFGLLGVGLFAIASPALATLINNPGFESDIVAAGGFTSVPPTDWDEAGGTSTGLLGAGSGFFPGPAAEGVNVAYANASAGIYLFQTTGEALTAGTTYDLTVAIGTRTDLTGTYEIRLTANGDTLNSTTAALGLNAAFSDVSVSYTATGADAQLGQLVQVELVALASQPLFDNVRLDATAIPEPSSLLLAGLGMIGLVGYGRRRK